MSQYEYVLQFSGSTVGSEAHMVQVPEADINACVPIQLATYMCTDASFTGVLKNFRTSAKNSGHGVNVRTIFKVSGLS